MDVTTSFIAPRHTALRACVLVHAQQRAGTWFSLRSLQTLMAVPEQRLLNVCAQLVDTGEIERLDVRGEPGWMAPAPQRDITPFPVFAPTTLTLEINP